MKVDKQRAPTAWRQLGPEFASRQCCSKNQPFLGLSITGFPSFSTSTPSQIQKKTTLYETTSNSAHPLQFWLDLVKKQKCRLDADKTKEMF